MLVMIVFITALLALRASGAAGARRFSTWRVCAAHALAVMLLLTASAHFVPPSVTAMPNQADMIAMVPPQLPFPKALVLATGVLELLGAAGLTWTRTRRPAGLCLALLFVAMTPANIHAALDPAQIDATSLWLRLPQQALYVSCALWIALSTRRTATDPEPAHSM